MKNEYCECGLSANYCRNLSKRGYFPCEARKKIKKLEKRPAHSEADKIALAYKKAGIL